MNPSDETSHANPEVTTHQSENDLSRLDWYDKTVTQSYDTCKVASPGVLLAIVFITFGLAMWAMSEMQAGPPIVYTIAFRALLTTIIALPFILFWTIFCLVAAMFAVAGLNASSGFALKARGQIGITGGLASFFCMLPLAFTGVSVTPQVSGAIAFGVTVAHLCAIWIASRPSTWLSWAAKKTIDNTTRRPQFELKHFFYLTACSAAVFSVAAISKELGIAIGVFVAVEAALVMLDAAWVRLRAT